MADRRKRTLNHWVILRNAQFTALNERFCNLGPLTSQYLIPNHSKVLTKPINMIP